MRRRVPAVVRVVSQNVGESTPGWEVANRLERALRDDKVPDRPHLILLQEARDTKAALKSTFGDDYKIYAPKGASSVTLVRRDVRHRVEQLHTHAEWIGPLGGRRHRGRNFPLVSLGGTLAVVNVHRVPGGPTGGSSDAVDGFNLEEWVEEHRLLRRLTRRAGPDEEWDHIALIGDHNESDPKLSVMFSVARLGICHRPNAKVDYAVTDASLGVHARRCGTYGAERPLIAYTLIPEVD